MSAASTNRAHSPKVRSQHNLVKPTFRALKVDLSKIDREWERERGAQIRIALLVLRDNRRQMTERFTKNDVSIETGMKIVEHLLDEAAYLKESIKVLDAAAARIMIVAEASRVVSHAK